MNTVIVIPTYNEKDNIRPLTEEIFKVTPDITILIVDDNSPDGTGVIADELSKKSAHIKVLHKERKEGLGGAYIAGFKEALKMNPDYIIQMDADFSHHPRYIPLLLNEAAYFDIVSGSRFVSGYKLSSNIGLLSFCANRYTKWILGLKVCDPLSGFKCLRREVIEKIRLDKFISKGFIFQGEFLYWASKLNLSIREIPIDFLSRRSGRSKKTIRVISEAVLELNLLLLQNKEYHDN